MPQGRGRGRGRVGGGSSRGRGRGRAGQSAGGFLAPRNGRQAAAAANAAAGAEFDPEINDLRSQAKGSRKREADLGRWYRELAGDYQGAQRAGAAALQGIEETTTRQLAEAGDRSSADLASLAAGDEKFAALVGGPRDASGLSQIAQAGAAAQRAQVALNLPVAQEQASFIGRLGGDKAAARMQGIEERRAEGRRRGKLRSDVATARKGKAAARVSRLEEIRESDRGYAMDRRQQRASEREAAAAERQAAADASLAQTEASRQAHQDAIDNRQEQERIEISRKNSRTSARAQRASARNYKEDNKGGLTPAEKRSRREHAGDAMSAAKALLGIKVPKNDKQWAQFEAALIEKLGSSYGAEAAAAVAKLREVQARKAATRSRRMHQGKIAGH